MPGAKLEHVRLQAEAPSVRCMSTSIGATLGARCATTARYMRRFGAQLSRLDIEHRAWTARARRRNLRNVAAPATAGIADITTVMDHASAAHHEPPALQERRRRHAAARSIRAACSVREGAVKSDSPPAASRRCCLSPRAEADAKPELEIFADDVNCGHGTAIGALDADALFYLRSRGIPEAEARDLLIRAFLEDAMADFADHADPRRAVAAAGCRARGHGQTSHERATAQDRPALTTSPRCARDFPILSREVHGKPLVYLDNARLGAEAERTCSTR